jgi:hypothetical protein
MPGTSGATSKADRVLQVLDIVVEPQALYNQRPGSAWAHPTSEVPDPTPGSWSSIRQKAGLGSDYIGAFIAT